MKTSATYSELAFPVIWIGTKDVRVSHDLLNFRTCHSGLYRAGYRKSGVVVDAKLVCREVLATRKVGYVPPLFGFRFPGARHLLVEYEWSDKPSQIVSLDELKRMIIDAKRRSGIYVAMAGSPKPYERKIQQFASYGDLVGYFGRPSKTGFFEKLWDGPFDG